MVFRFQFKWQLLVRYLVFASGTLYLFFLSKEWGADWRMTGLIAATGSVLVAVSLYLIRPIGLVKLVRAGEA